MDKEKIKEMFEEEIKKGDTTKAKEALENEESIIEKVLSSKRLKKYYEDVKLFFKMLKDYFDGKCDLPVMTVVAIGVALIYILNPFDVVPDVIPVVGYVDDALVLSFCLFLIEEDVENYKKNCL